MKITFKVWILIVCVLFSILAIFSMPPTFMQRGVLVKSVERNSSIFENGLRSGDIIVEINNQKINNMQDYSRAMQDFLVQAGEGKAKLQIKTKNKEIIGLFSKNVTDQIIVSEIPKTRIKTGLDLQGGARALVATDEPITDSQLDDLIDIARQRFNVYGLTDVQLRKVSDLSGNKFMLVEIAGSSPADLENLISQQGKFEAKIGNETVFVGGRKDITYVGRTGHDAGITDCFKTQSGEVCRFRFVVSLSEEAAKRHANITSKLGINLSTGGQYLDKTLDLYLDGKLIDSLNIGADLKGKVATQVQVSGSGLGLTRKEAFENAKLQMKKLQTILITGSLPFKLKIKKIDRISPRLGKDFTKHILFAAIFAVIAVSLLIFIRYRNLKISIALISVSFSEVIIILGIAALIKWNLDLPSIAGIIATIGTGIDSQLIILDETRLREESIKQRIKKALFIIVTAFATTFVALIPLTGALSFMGIGAASAGLLKGFAVTTLIGISVGVLISRPAFAEIAKGLVEE